jgi:quercetin dioxygenase-like cupin family protein
VADAAGESDRAAAKANNGGTTMGAIDPARVATHSFDWGVIKWMVSPDQTPGAKITFGEVVLLPGQGHVRHNHPFSEEILYVLSGGVVRRTKFGPREDWKSQLRFRLR